MANYRINLSVNSQQAQQALRGVASTGVTANNRIASSTRAAASAYERLTVGAEKMKARLAESIRGMDGKSAIRSLNSQIRQMEKLNSLRRKAAMMELREERAAGTISNDDFRRESAAISSGFGSNALEIEILKNILAELRSSSQEQIQNDSRQANEVIQENRRNGLQGDDDAQLSSAFQEASMGGGVGEDEDEDEGEGRVKGFLRKNGERVNRALGQAADSDNEIFAAAALAGMIPVFGQGLSSFFGKALNEAQELQVSRVGIGGMSTSETRSDGFGAKFGLKISDFNSQFVNPATRASGDFSKSKELGRESLILNRSLGVDTATIFDSIKNLRTADEKSPLNIANSLQTTLERVGAVNKGDFTKLEEFMGVNNRLLAQQLVSLDQISSDTNLSLLTGLSEIGGAYSDPRVAEAIATTIDDAIKNPSNDFIQSMQYDVLSRQNPGSSVFDILEMQSQGIQNKDLVQGMIEKLVKDGGSKDDIMLQARTIFNMEGKEGLLRGVVEKAMNGQSIYADLTKDERFNENAVSSKRLGQVSSTLLQNTAVTNDAFALGGDQISTELNKTLKEVFGGGIPDAINGVLEFTSSAIGAAGDGVKFAKEAADKLENMSKNIEKITSWGSRIASPFFETAKKPTSHE
jgi:hypothetical protein